MAVTATARTRSVHQIAFRYFNGQESAFSALTLLRKLRILRATVIHKQFAKLLQVWRAENNYSQRDAAQVLGCSKRSLENWEQERSMPQGFGLNAMLSLIESPKGSLAAKTLRKPARKRK